MISLKTLIMEGNKVTVPVGGEKIKFSATVSTNGKLILIASSSSDIDKLQDVISILPPHGVRNALLNYIEKKLKVPFQHDMDHPGAGYGFKVDMYSLIKGLK